MVIASSLVRTLKTNSFVHAWRPEARRCLSLQAKHSWAKGHVMRATGTTTVTGSFARGAPIKGVARNARPSARTSAAACHGITTPS